MSTDGTVIIRKMHEQDRASVVAILEHWNMQPRDIPDPETTGLARNDPVFVALHEDKVIGVASYLLHAAGRAETVSLAVDPLWRGKGIGEMLQSARLEEMKAIGVRTVMTECDRPEVIQWYQRKFGYRVAGTRTKKHDFSLRDVGHWTVLELDLESWIPA